MTLQIKNTPDGLGGSIEVGGQPRLVFNSDGTLSGLQSPLPSEINTKKLVTMDLFSGSKLANGYQKLPSGLIIQWGVASGVPDNGLSTVIYPMAFPTRCAVKTCSLTRPQVGGTEFTSVACTNTATPLTSMQIWYNTTAVIPGLVDIEWFAIGY